MTEVFAAAVLDSLPGPKYTAGLRYAELALRSPWPKAPTLKRARYAFPEGFRAGLRFPASCMTSARGALRFDDAMEESLKTALSAAEALAASVVVLCTPLDATPGARDRQLWSEFVQRLPREEGRLYVWAPSGLWEVSDAQRVAADLGLVLACDPLESEIPAGPVAYCRLQALGGRTRFSEAMLRRVTEQLDAAGTERAYVAIESDRSFEQATLLDRLSRDSAIGGSAFG